MLDSALVWATSVAWVLAGATVAALWFGAANTLSACMLAYMFGSKHFASNFG